MYSFGEILFWESFSVLIFWSCYKTIITSIMASNNNKKLTISQSRNQTFEVTVLAEPDPFHRFRRQWVPNVFLLFPQSVPLNNTNHWGCFQIEPLDFIIDAKAPSQQGHAHGLSGAEHGHLFMHHRPLSPPATPYNGLDLSRPWAGESAGWCQLMIFSRDHRPATPSSSVNVFHSAMLLHHPSGSRQEANPILVAPAWPRAEVAPTRGAHWKMHLSCLAHVCVLSASSNDWSSALLL